MLSFIVFVNYLMNKFQVTTTAMKSVRVKAIPFVPEVGQDHVGSMDVMVSVEALAAACVPIDLVAVLDVTVSMGWGATPSADKPTRLDMLKSAMKFVVRQLRDCDSIALVPFINEEVVSDAGMPLSTISASTRVEVNKKIDELKVQTSKCTALL